MSYKVYIYAFMLFVTTFSLSGVNFNNFFKKNHVLEARLFILLLILSISFLSSSFIISFIEAT